MCIMINLENGKLVWSKHCSQNRFQFRSSHNSGQEQAITVLPGGQRQGQEAFTEIHASACKQVHANNNSKASANVLAWPECLFHGLFIVM